MPAYFDTSAIVPLLIAEPSSERCANLWQRAELVFCSALALVEVHAALAQAERIGRVTSRARIDALTAFDARWRDVAVIEARGRILVAAASLAATHALRGYDAVHCASGLAVASRDTFAVSGDGDLLRAWDGEGLATADTRR